MLQTFPGMLEQHTTSHWSLCRQIELLWRKEFIALIFQITVRVKIDKKYRGILKKH